MGLGHKLCIAFLFLLAIWLIDTVVHAENPPISASMRRQALADCEKKYPGAAFIASLDLKTGKVDCSYGSLRAIDKM